MSNGPLLPLSPDEALHAFMDGELANSEEQHLFDELATNPTLRGELKDVLSIRQAVLHDITAPPAEAESGLLATLGFQGAQVGAGAAIVGQTIVGTTAATMSSFPAALTAVLLSVGGLGVGFIAAWLIFSNQSQGSHQSDYSQQRHAALYQGGIAGDPTLHAVVHAPTDTVRSVQYVTVLRPKPKTEPQSNIVQSNNGPNHLNKMEEQQSNLFQTNHAAENTQTTTLLTEAAQIPLQFGSLPAGVPAKASFLSPQNDAGQATVRLRTLASGIRSTDPAPTSIQRAIAPNTSFALLFPLSSNQKLGVELGTESFRQEFSSVMQDNRQLMVLQTPVLFWMGATYEFLGTDLTIVEGLSPFAIATLGYAYSQGPLSRATIGLSYQPIGPLRFSVGLDAAVLGYQFQSNWFASRKWGVSYGVSIDLGAIR